MESSHKIEVYFPHESQENAKVDHPNGQVYGQVYGQEYGQVYGPVYRQVYGQV